MIRLANVSKYYHSKKGVSLGLRKINLEFRKKEFIAITGESGSGKSTLLNVISGSDTYEEGEMYINGEATSHYTKEEWEDYRKNNVAFIYQGYNLIDSYTVLENVQAAMLIGGNDNDIDDKAYKYLEKVGLENLWDNKGVELSSGQKQRLAIARALAKETEIIVADEPTGNLDRENGMQVMEILSELSKEKMVIVVTHNYDQAEPYATRKIRMYNGEVAEDMDIIRDEKGNITENAHIYQDKDIDEREEEKENILGEYVGYTKHDLRMKKYKMAWQFVKVNRKSQPKRNFFLFMLFIFVTASFFILYGNLFANIDSATTGYYSTAAFKNGDPSRLVVKKIDNSVMTWEDVKKISGISKVKEVDLYDTINDYNYFCEENKDYTVVYEPCENPGTDEPDKTYVKMLDFSKFMRSVTCISESDLAAGTLPLNFNEIVVYSNDTGIIGQTKKVYVSNSKTWSSSQYMELELTITGVLKYPTDQIYFSEILCKYLSVNIKKIESSMYIAFGGNGRGMTTQSSGLKGENAEENSSAIKYPGIIFKPNNDLTGNSVNMSSYFYDTAVKYQGYTKVQKKVCKDTVLKYTDPEGNIQYINLSLTKKETGSGNLVIEVSYEVFDTIFTDMDTTQITVYMDDYAYTDKVMKAISKEGYDVISVYRVGTTSYDMDAVLDNLKAMAISAAALVFIFILGWMLIHTLLKLKKSDFIIFKSIGMSQEMVHRIVSMDVLSGLLISSIISVFITYVLSMCDIRFISNVVKGYKLIYVIIYFATVYGLGALIVRSYSRYLRKHDRITDLKEE